MWQEAQSGEVDLKLPSINEMKTAFQRIGDQRTSGAFAFFIDGIDEFTGNHRDGISFVKSFITSANIKILLSSRPIDTCVAAFSSAPKLRVQDLTKPDIATYINDVVRSHPYVCESNCLSDATVEGLAEDIQSKASGVFLWVVLACRTLIEGFEAYDDAEELRRRVDELPPELEQLFRHILDGLPSRFVQQAAKLLRVCYISRVLQIENRISAFRLAWAHEKDMKPHALGDLVMGFFDEREKKCAILKGRLRSRCRGLLEVSTMPVHARDNPSVDFMHRTVFEFLNTPAVWAMDCLQIHDHEFEATTVLAYMSCHKVNVRARTLCKGNGEILMASKYIREVERVSPSNLSHLLNCFAYALGLPVDDTDISSTRNGPDDAVNETVLLLAIELDLVAFVGSHDLRKIFALRKLHSPDANVQWNLVHHALNKPVLFERLATLDEYQSSAATLDEYPSSAAMINLLLQAGCTPNESIAVSGIDRKTCWENWMESECMTNSGSVLDIRSAEITMLMIRGGALVGVTHFDREQNTLKSLLRKVGDPKSVAKRIENLQDRTKWIALCNEIAEAVASSISASDSEEIVSEADTDHEENDSNRVSTDGEGDWNALGIGSKDEPIQIE